MIYSDKRIIAQSHDVAKSLFAKGIGVMFKKKIERPLVFIFNTERKIGLHMMFVFFPIDVIYLNKVTEKNNKIKGTIIEIKKKLLPWEIYNPANKASVVIEMKEKSIEKHNLQIGDIISIK